MTLAWKRISELVFEFMSCIIVNLSTCMVNFLSHNAHHGYYKLPHCDGLIISKDH